MTSRPPRSGISSLILQTWCGLLLVMADRIVAEERHPTRIRADLAVERLERAASGKLEVARSPLTGLATFVSAGPRQSIPLSVSSNESADARSRAFLTDYGAAFGITDPSQLRTIGASYADEAGTEHVRLQQIHDGIPVTGAEVIIHLKGASVTAVSAKTLPVPDSDSLRPVVPVEEALRSAR